ncbi:MAG: tRNA (N(6)-L-threonylcarbamoyladenosine(37)-C(2))-methylthiotransferase MtaB [Thomasclavelia ramosa]|nr:tRNA (N(6)-L-threonylcarbamoyladenosine(37)-C(2))-methylthiotransferase MtaB [Thomasclavelia ramosa]
MKTVAFHTLGCKVNTYESNAMLKIFNEAGYQEVDFKQVADVYVINTCTVTNTGDSKSRQMIRKAIRKNPKATICVVGCYSQTAPEEIEKIEGVGVVLGTQYRSDIVKYVDEHLETGEMVIKVDNVMNLRKFEDLNIDRFKNTRAFLKIQDGCNNFCTYCIIPYARGRVRSRQKESVLNQAQRLVDNGYVEIVLTGIHTAGYGEDLDDYSFYELLVDLVKIKGLKRLRISSIETSQISDEIIDLIGSNGIIVDHLHVPLQAGSDATLKRMNRKYTTAEYLEKINKIRSYLPNIAFTTDVIVGFPGETDEEFEETYNFIKQVNYSELHVFPYSPRKNTPAAKMKDQVNDQIKHERANRLLQLSKELNHEFALKQIGKTLKVLFEKRDGEYLIGHAGDYLKVKVKTADNLIGEIVTIKIDKYDEILEGRVV